MQKLIMEFVLFKNVLLAEVVQMPEDLRAKGDLCSITVANFNFYLKSYSRPMISADSLYLPGRVKSADKLVFSASYDTEEEAALYKWICERLVNKINEGR